MLLCKMSKKKEAKEVISFSFFDRKWNNWNPLRLITWVARQPKDSSNCPSSFMFELWKILLPLVTTLYEMQWLEVLVPTLTGNPTIPLKIYLSTTAVKYQFREIGKKQQQSGSVIMSLCILNSTSHPCSFLVKLFLHKVLHTCSKLIWILVTNSLVFIVITTMLVIMVTLITITVLPKLTLFWV